MFSSSTSRVLTASGKHLVNFRRWLSDTVIPTLAFSQMKEELKTRKPILIDVREKQELVTDGKIKGSVNIPLGEIVQAMELNDENFKKLYGFKKPSQNDNIVTHCKMGVRAMKAAVALNQNGFKSVRVYSGIKDWTENGGPLEK